MKIFSRHMNSFNIFNPFSRLSFVLILLASILSNPAASQTEPGFVPLFDKFWEQNWVEWMRDYAYHKDRHLKRADTVNGDVLTADNVSLPKKAKGGSHMYYEGPLGNGAIKNFELKTDVKLSKDADGGIFFRTQYQNGGWPKFGYELQLNNTGHNYWRTGSIHGLYKIKKSPVKNDEWFSIHLIAKGQRFIVYINDEKVTDWTVPPEKARKESGSFALQTHGREIQFRNMRVKLLPDD